MIALLALALAAEAPPVDGLPIGVLPRQDLPAKGCAAYLFTTGTARAMVAMASAEPAQLRLTIDGATIDVARASQSGEGGFGFAGTTEYVRAEVTATLNMTITPRGDIVGGAAVPEATLRIDRPGKDGVVLPLAGLIGCA